MHAGLSFVHEQLLSALVVDRVMTQRICMHACSASAAGAGHNNHDMSASGHSVINIPLCVNTVSISELCFMATAGLSQQFDSILSMMRLGQVHELYQTEHARQLPNTSGTMLYAYDGEPAAQQPSLL